MPEIPQIGIETVSVPTIPAAKIIPPPKLPSEPPVTLMLGFPVADIPGGEIPYYEPLDYTPGQHNHQTQPAPRPATDRKPAERSDQPAPVPKSVVPNPTDLLNVQTELPCPPADAIPLGAKNKSQTAIIIGYKLVDGECKEQLKPLAVPQIIGNYLPAGPVVATTASIAVAATTAAVFAKPLGDFLLKAIKPIVKKTIKKLKEKIGKKTKVESVFERQKFQRSLRK